MKILFKYLRPHRGWVALLLLLSGMNIGFSLIDPIIFGKLVNLANHYASNPAAYDANRFFWSFTENPHYGVAALLFTSIAVAMVSRIAKSFQDFLLTRITQQFGAAVFTEGLQHAMQLPYQEFEDARSGETLSVLQKVRTDTEKLVASFINILFPVIVGILFVAVYAASIHWSLPPIYFGGIFMLTIISNLLSKKVKTIQKRIVGQTTALAGATTESLRNIELVKSLGLTTQEVNRLNRNTFKILGLELTKVKRVRSISFIQGTFVNTLRQIILFMLLWLIFREKLNAGQLVTMQIFSFFVFGPLQEIGNIILTYREAQTSLENFGHLMEKKPEPAPSAPVVLGPIEQLAFDGVLFRNRTAGQPAVNRISFEARRGETIAFVGPSGSGKTTLMKLLVGLYRPQEGTIYFNNTPESKIHFQEVRDQIGFVTQDTQLFSGTIRENLLFVRPDATEPEMIDVLKRAACQNLLDRSELGLDSLIGEGGLKLSGGEKQRLSIARALLRKPRLLLFDEATSALDSITEEEINNTIRQVSQRGEQITVLIAHRLSTILHADRIYVLEKGDIVETGTHESLLAEKGLYFAMWRQQIGERKTNQND